MRKSFAGLRALVRKRKAEREMDEELHGYLEAAAEAKMRAGMSGEEARRAAWVEMGSTEAVKEGIRDAGWERALESFWQDVRYGARMLRRNPGFALVAVLALALGIGANTAIFGVASNIFLRPLPFPHEEQLLRLDDSMALPDGHRSTIDMRSRDFLVVKEQSSALGNLVALGVEHRTLLGGNEPERVAVVLLSSGWRKTLGVEPVRGRFFSSSELRAGTDSGVVVIGYDLWQRHFGGDPSILGKSIRLDASSCRVIGIMPAGFRFPHDGDIWTPVTIDPQDRFHEYVVFGRLRPGATLTQARAELNGIAERVKSQYPDTARGFGMAAFPMRESLFNDQAQIALALLAVVGFFLLLSCATVANLLLARSVARRQEMAIRAALGAGRGRQACQLFSESLLLSGLGCGAGLLMVAWLSPALATLVPTNLSEQLNLGHVGMDWRVLGFTAAISVITAVLCGLAPLRTRRQASLQPFLKEGARTGGSLTSGKLQRVFVVAELGLATVLLLGAGLLLGHLHELVHRDLGFRAAGLLTLEMSPPQSWYATGQTRSELAWRILAQVRALPDVSGAGITTVNPLRGMTWIAPIVVEGREPAGEHTNFFVNHRLISPGLFQAMGIPLLAGRDFSDADRQNSPLVAIVSRRMAHHFWPEESPIGKRARVAGPGRPWLTVVGVVGDVADQEDPGAPRETWYLPYAQHPGSAESIQLMVRGRSDKAGLVKEVKEAIWKTDSRLAVGETATMDGVYSNSLSRDRLGALIVSLVAIFGLFLAALGVFGLMSFLVNGQMHEIAVRMALGAGRGEVLRMVGWRGLRLTLAGVSIGLVASLGLSRVITSLMSGVEAPGLPTYATVSCLLCAVALLACYVPARRAMRVDPVTALRHE